MGNWVICKDPNLYMGPHTPNFVFRYFCAQSRQYLKLKHAYIYLLTILFHVFTLSLHSPFLPTIFKVYIKVYITIVQIQ